jgi:hypothetical protein
MLSLLCTIAVRVHDWWTVLRSSGPARPSVLRVHSGTFPRYVFGQLEDTLLQGSWHRNTKYTFLVRSRMGLILSHGRLMMKSSCALYTVLEENGHFKFSWNTMNWGDEFWKRGESSNHHKSRELLQGEYSLSLSYMMYEFVYGTNGTRHEVEEENNRSQIVRMTIERLLAFSWSKITRRTVLPGSIRLILEVQWRGFHFLDNNIIFLDFVLFLSPFCRVS